ncbi:efflux RND transporter periplasmic adaptor subunit [Billgrantia ethanolica]|uniref:Efflux RND transporter periplasmic adaptor subunit n=1 Tax=Billgrantia ethanolica TaxID=2733486 RepID=A0ABS9A4C4_9GAMM|nr:efflux RND transporter periplasmic adaptor subunit [Halomonas ethanolica]MCE8003460.1 efflux RND transporter periplasmic adaptor subunit [Halomonas ethanolica]
MPASPLLSLSTPGRACHRQRGRLSLGALLAVLVLATGAAGAWWLVSQPPRIERRAPVEAPAPLVDTVLAQRQAAAPSLHGFGRVIAEREAHLASRVSGELLEFTDEALPGRVVEAGSVLARLDDADLRLALREAEAAVAQAEAALAMERGEQQRAETEYRSFGRELSAERRALVLRQPQLRQAEAEVERARAARDRARLELERATLTAPWRGMVQSRLLGSGSMVNNGTELLHLVDVSRFWIRVSLPGEALDWLYAADANGPGSAVTLSTRTWSDGETRHGKVIAILPALEEQGLQAQLLVAVDDPLGLDSGAAALRLGDVVRLEFEARPQDDLFVLPAAALRPGDELWLLDEEERLRRRTVSVIHRGETRVLIADGLEDGERVVTSQLGQPRTGMRLRSRIADSERPAGERRESRS